MMYSLDPREVRKVLDAKLNKQPFDEKQFLYYHLNRNYFNVKSEVTTLTKMYDGNYKDNLGQVWHELSTWGNFYHMPTNNWMLSSIGVTAPYSRKFLRDDNTTGVGGEFEMIIRHDGKRIDAITNATYQETYNFSRTTNTTNHNKLDVSPHREDSNYAVRLNTGKVTIKEK